LSHPDAAAQAALARIRHGHRITFALYLTATGVAMVSPCLALAMNVAVRLHLLHLRSQIAPTLLAGENQGAT